MWAWSIQCSSITTIFSPNIIIIPSNLQWHQCFLTGWPKLPPPGFPHPTLDPQAVPMNIVNSKPIHAFSNWFTSCEFQLNPCTFLSFVLLPYPHHLLIDTSLPTSGDRIVLHELNQCITSHLATYAICFPPSPFGDNGATQDNPNEYEKAEWVLLQLGRLTCDSVSQPLKVAMLMTWQLTTATIIANINKVSKTMKNPLNDTPLLLAAPRFRKLTGPINVRAAIHSCFASQVMDGFFTMSFPEETQNPQCFSTCLSYATEQHIHDLMDVDDDDNEFNTSISSTITHINAAVSTPGPLPLTSSPTPMSFMQMLPISTSQNQHASDSGARDDTSLATSCHHIHFTRSAARTLQSQTVPSELLVHSTVADWMGYVQDQAIPECNAHPNPWRGEGQTVGDVADLLAMFIYYKFGKVSIQMSSLPTGLTLGLFMKNRTYKVGRGLGEGVEWAVLAEAVNRSTNDLSTWVQTTDVFKVLSVLPFGVLDPKAEARLRAHGLLCALHISALGQPPLPCSPFLIAYCLGAFELILDHSFVMHLTPDVGAALSAIPADHNNNLDLSATGCIAALLATYLNIQPAQISVADMLLTQ
ncbi:hypothetical protein PAXRUDRAFT_26642 [Paxillus rubicundulus Ve08.2h10]|uniref:Unplaced genomic scaffold scaffold_435, whole genome shotgun sequence n=1 Tax=Paxillus rubicundulus Ve08.2h10 TaxID=930991 RepID=A0A0D0E5B3_9AGAM|nr:hypothetical protein PAXRUDRAFT_26642 [Paxillus rubicundulus Ve08.2h10]